MVYSYSLLCQEYFSRIHYISWTLNIQWETISLCLNWRLECIQHQLRMGVDFQWIWFDYWWTTRTWWEDKFYFLSFSSMHGSSLAPPIPPVDARLYLVLPRYTTAMQELNHRHLRWRWQAPISGPDHPVWPHTAPECGWSEENCRCSVCRWGEECVVYVEVSREFTVCCCGE